MGMALDRIRWKGEATYRVLSYYFAVRWNVAEVEEILERILGPFAVASDPDEYPMLPVPGFPPRYSIIRRRSERPPYRLIYGGCATNDNAASEMFRAEDLQLLLGHLFSDINGQTIRRTGSFLLIHSGAVCTPAGAGVLLPAQSGSGKTTLTTALVRAGFQYLSDEAAAIDPVTRMVHPYRKALTMKMGHVDLFPDLCPNGNGKQWMSGQWPVPAEEIRAGSVGGPCPVRFIIAPAYQRGAPTEVTPVTAAQGTMLLLSNTLNLPIYRSRALRVAADVARDARSYRLVSGGVEGAVAAITEITAPGPSTEGAVSWRREGAASSP